MEQIIQNFLCFLSFLLLFLHIPLQWMIGRSIVLYLTQNKEIHIRSASEWILGLVVYLLFFTLLKSIGVPFFFSLFIPYLLLVFKYSEFLNLISKCLALRLTDISWNFSLWLSLHLILGVSLFSTLSEKIVTPWKNSYGDLPYHLGMISSFVYGDNFPPEQFILAGELLSYPYLINIWSAQLWYLQPTLYFLSIIFIYQWIVLWGAIYQILRGDKNILLPWMLLLGGGTYFALFSNSGTEIGAGFVWTSFLTTLWVPQRATLIGLPLCLSALSLFFNVIRFKKKCSFVTRKNSLLISGLFLGACPLAHTHFGLVTGVFISYFLASSILFSSENRREEVALLISFWIGACVSIHALPFLLQKNQILSIKSSYIFNNLDINTYDIFVLSIKNFIVPIILFFGAWFFTKKHQIFLSLTFLIIVVWNVKSSEWHWDQVKTLVGCYIVLISICAHYYQKVRLFLICFLPILVVPVLLDIFQMAKESKEYAIFSRYDLQLSDRIRKTIPPRAVVLAAPEHNSYLALSGRRQYMGYEGWLWSQGLHHYRERLDRVKTLQILESCNFNTELCPQYLVYGARERVFWKKKSPSFENLELLAPEVYKIKKR